MLLSDEEITGVSLFDRFPWMKEKSFICVKDFHPKSYFIVHDSTFRLRVMYFSYSSYSKKTYTFLWNFLCKIERYIY